MPCTSVATAPGKSTVVKRWFDNLNPWVTPARVYHPTMVPKLLMPLALVSLAPGKLMATTLNVAPVWAKLALPSKKTAQIQETQARRRRVFRFIKATLNAGLLPNSYFADNSRMDAVPDFKFSFRGMTGLRNFVLVRVIPFVDDSAGGA